MINEEYTPAVDLDENETTTDSTENETPESDEEQGVEYWKAEALKNKAILDRNKKKPEAKKETDGFGLEVKGYLKASGINSNEFDFVKEEMRKAGEKDVETFLDNPYFQNRLETHRENAKAAAATPNSKRSGGVATGSAEYWAAKPIEDVPQDMRRAVVKLKRDKESSGGVFYNS